MQGLKENPKKCSHVHKGSYMSAPLVADIENPTYMSAHVLLNLSNELGKRDKMLGLHFSILSLFRNEFD